MPATAALRQDNRTGHLYLLGVSLPVRTSYDGVRFETAAEQCWYAICL
jgi:hypothetical protein